MELLRWRTSPRDQDDGPAASDPEKLDARSTPKPCGVSVSLSTCVTLTDGTWNFFASVTSSPASSWTKISGTPKVGTPVMRADLLLSTARRKRRDQ
jgi:hypothetical protein